MVVKCKDCYYLDYEIIESKTGLPQSMEVSCLSGYNGIGRGIHASHECTMFVATERVEEAVKEHVKENPI